MQDSPSSFRTYTKIIIFREEIGKIINGLAYYTKQPEKTIAYLLKKRSVQEVVETRDPDLETRSYMDSWWYDGRHVKLNRAMVESALGNVVLADFFNLSGMMKSFKQSPFCLR